MKKILTFTSALMILFIQAKSQNTWTKKSSISSSYKKHSSVSFALGGYGYVGSGWDGTSSTNDFWKYDPLKDTWTQIASISGARHIATSFVIDTLAYVGLGTNNNTGTSVKSDFYEYNPSNNTWTSKASLSNGIQGASGCSVGGYGYVLCGFDGSASVTDVWKYDPVNDSWSSVTSFPGSARIKPMTFVVGNYIYAGGGYVSSGVKDFYAYSADSDVWHQISSYPQNINYGAVFEINGIGYVAGGDASNSTVYNTTYAYDPTQDTWTKMANFGGGYFSAGIGFSIGSHGYAGLGINAGTYLKEMYRYDTKATSIIIDSLQNYTFCKGQSDTIYFSVTNIFDTSNNYIIQASNNGFTTSTAIGKLKSNHEGSLKAEIVIPTSMATDSFQLRIIASKPSFTGATFSKYIHIKPSPAATLVSSKDSVCDGDSSVLSIGQRDPGSMLTWYKNGNMSNDTSESIVIKSTGNYYIQVTGTNGCIANSNSKTINIFQNPQASLYSIKDSVCEGDSIQIQSVNNNSGDKYSWSYNGSTVANSNTSKWYASKSGYYQLTITNIYGCKNESSAKNIVMNPIPDAQIYHTKDTVCKGDSILLTSMNNNSGDQITWFLNGNTITNAGDKDLYARQSGIYALNINSAYGCKDRSSNVTLTFLTVNAPTITSSGKTLISSKSDTYQWYLDGVIITGETNQTITPVKNGLYTVVASNSFGCSATSSSFSVAWMGIQDIQSTIEMNIYPNPTQQEFQLSTSSFTKNSTIQIINMNGQTVQQIQLTTNMINVSVADLFNGIYLIQLVNNGEILVQKKLIKE